MTDLSDAKSARRYVEAAAVAAGLDLSEDEVSATVEQFQIVARLAAQLPCDLADTLEPAPRFEP
jgi:hypothetical protein